MQGVDYSYGRPGAAAIRAAGKEFVVRYLGTYDGDERALTEAEVAELHASGLGIGAVYESTAARALGGYVAGVADASRARDALAGLGFPPGHPIYFAVDFDAQPAQFAAIDDYLAGAASVLGLARIGVYGGYGVIDHCVTQRSATWFWQTAAWSGGRRHAYCHLYQYLNAQSLNGALVDFNEAYGIENGLWWPEEDGMMQQQFEDLVLAVFAGSEERDEQGATRSREERLTVAMYRLTERAEGREQSVLQEAAEAQQASQVSENRTPDVQAYADIGRAIAQAGAAITAAGNARAK